MDEINPPVELFTIFRLDEGTTANEPACGEYDAVIDVLLDDKFVVIDGEFVVIDCKTAVELTIAPPAIRLALMPHAFTTFTTEKRIKPNFLSLTFSIQF